MLVCDIIITDEKSSAAIQKKKLYCRGGDVKPVPIAERPAKKQ